MNFINSNIVFPNVLKEIKRLVKLRSRVLIQSILWIKTVYGGMEIKQKKKKKALFKYILILFYICISSHKTDIHTRLFQFIDCYQMQDF